MNRIILALSFCLLAGPAVAEPFSLGTAIFSFLASYGLPAQIAVMAPFLSQVINVAALVGGSLLVSLLAPKPNVNLDPGAARDTFKSEASPELRAVGRVRLGGLIPYGNTSVVDRYRLQLHCKGEVDGYESYYLSGFEVILNAAGEATTYLWQNAGDPFVTIQSKIGTTTESAWPDLIAAFPDHWTNAHRVRGIAQSLIKYVSPGFANELFPRLYQQGVPPLQVTMRAEKNVYDPRIVSSQWTENGILNALHILLSYPERSLADIDLDFVGDEADRADVAIATLNGDVARSRCWGVWSSETARGENLQKVLDSVGAWVVPRDGGLKVGLQLIDDDPTAEMTIDLRHIVELTWKSGPEGVERPNRCRLKYYSPERNFELAEIDLSGIDWANIEDEIDAYGEKPIDIELPYCPNAGQAQRRARQMFSLARSDSGILKTNMAGLAAWGCRIVNVEFPDDLGTIKCLIKSPKVLDNEGLVEIAFAVWPTLPAWNTAVHEAPAPDIVPDITIGTALDTPVIPTGVTVVDYTASAVFHTRFGFTVPADADPGLEDVGIEAVYRFYDGDKPLPWRQITDVILPTVAQPELAAHAFVASNLTGQRLDFRFRTWSEAAGISSSPWSPVLEVVSPAIDNTAPAAPTIDAVLAGTITITVTAPDSLNVAYLTFTGPDAPGTTNVKPGEIVTWTSIAPGPGLTSTWTTRAHSSNGSQSAQASDAVTTPP